MNFDLNFLYKSAFFSSLVGLFLFIYDLGFQQSAMTQSLLDGFYLVVLILGMGAIVVRYSRASHRFKTKVVIFDAITVFYTLGLLVLMALNASQVVPFSFSPLWMKFAIFLTFIREYAEQQIIFNRNVLNPAQLFITSFFVVILTGAFLLMLPNATHQGMSFIDALFTSTSAVCVTGLIVVDTSTYYTPFGLWVIMLLIQIGGLGILTFASYFSYFFTGGASYENQLSIGEMTNANKLGEVFSTVKYIILITLIVELTSASLIFLSLTNVPFDSFGDKVFFSIFHAVSAFCNAGFSTLQNNLYETGFRFNYGLQFTVILTLVFGGLGFPIVANIVKYLQYRIRLLLRLDKKNPQFRPWILTINSRITLITTSLLILIGFVGFFWLEYQHTLAEHGFFGKIITALFGATTPRTAGFNSVDMTKMAFPTVMLTFLLMWIGASPASTGGGIKTSTFAIATLNLLSLAQSKSRIEVFGREIADISIRRAFATISLSLIVIGFGIMLISIFDPDKGLMNIAFECFSAFSTVGLSLGITAGLTDQSKFVLIMMMFIGRVSMLTILVAVFKRVKHKNYRFPTEEITIN